MGVFSGWRHRKAGFWVQHILELEFAFMEVGAESEGAFPLNKAQPCTQSWVEGKWSETDSGPTRSSAALRSLHTWAAGSEPLGQHKQP